MATNEVCTALRLALLVISTDSLDCDSSNERFRLSGLLEEVGGVAEHDGRTDPELVVEWEERYDCSTLNAQ